jgi:type IV pilus assembly protein PilW
LKTIKTGLRERGVSIVELMVAMTIGLILTTAIGTIFVANTKTFRTQDDQARLQETSRAALDVLGYHIRQAGFVDIADDSGRIQQLTPGFNPSIMAWLQKTDASHSEDMLAKFFGKTAPYVGIKALKGCDGAFASTAVTLPWACAIGAAPDSITVTYQAQPTVLGGTTVRTANTYQDTLGAYNSATGQGGDCGAQDVNASGAAPKGPLAINRFYIDTTNNRLMCVGNGDPTKARPIAEGVEFMRITYGVIPATIGTAPMDSFVARYVKAADVPDWSRVLAVRVCLLIASPTANIATNVTTYTDCDGPPSKAQTDGKIRRAFNATYSLRNNMLTIPDALP